MIKAFVLVMVMGSSNSGTYVITADFNSMESCQYAMNSIMEKSKGVRVQLNQCYPK